MNSTMDTINSARNRTRFISTSEEAIQPVLVRSQVVDGIAREVKPELGGEPAISRTEEVDQKDAVAPPRLGTLRDEQEVCGKDGRAELRWAERELPRIGRPGPSAVASPES